MNIMPGRELLCMCPHLGGMSKHIVNVCSSSVEQSASQQQFMSHDVTCKSHEHMVPEDKCTCSQSSIAPQFTNDLSNST